MSHVFVSYSHSDGDFAENLRNKIEEVVLTAWLDEEKLKVGENWREKIDQAIRDSFALIAIMTPSAKESEYVTYEWAFAWGIGIKLIPLILKPTTLHPRLEALQWLDFSNRNARPWDLLMKTLKEEAELSKHRGIRISQDVLSIIRNFAEALDNPDPNQRKMALEGLAEINTSESKELLFRALDHPLLDVRYHAIIMLGETKYITAMPKILEILEHGSIELKIAASEALGLIGEIDAVSKLIEALEHEDDELRIRVVEALGKIRDERAVPILADILDKEYQRFIDKKSNSQEIDSQKIRPWSYANLFGITNYSVSWYDFTKRESFIPTQQKSLTEWIIIALKNIGTKNAKSVVENWEERLNKM